MKPTEKAKDLVDKFREYVWVEITGEFGFTFKYEQQTKNAKACALISVKEILSAIPKQIGGRVRFDNPDIDFWKEVKAEIKKL